MNQNQIILNTDDAAAKRTTVHGWVSRDGLFYGENERTARWAGCTHVACQDCGQPTPKHYIKCANCRLKGDIAKHAARERKPYESGMLYSDALQRFFADDHELLDYIADEEQDDHESLRVVLCSPVYPRYVDYDNWSDDLPEDATLDDVAPDLTAAVSAVNAAIDQMRKDGKAIAWQPSQSALDWASILNR